MRALAFAMFIAVTAIILGSLLLGCGAEGEEGDMDIRYEQCLDAGGSFSQDGYRDWECDMPPGVTSDY